MAPDDEFESFRGALADLDADRERRIRQKFESGRRAAGPTVTSPAGSIADAEPVELVRADTARPAAARRPRHSALIAVAAAVALVALLAGLTLFRSSGTTTDVGSATEGIAADNPLADVAAKALARPDVDLIGDQVLYQQRTSATFLDATGATAPGFLVDDTEMWARRDGTGREIRTPDFVATGPGEPLNPGSATDRTVTDPSAFLEVRDYDEIRALPTDPAALTSMVGSFVGDDPTLVAEALAALLSLDVTPPAVRAAGFQALGDLGAGSIGSVATPSGVTGAAYQGTGAGGRLWVIVIDPESTKLLAFAADAGTADELFLDASRWREYGAQRVEDSIPS